MSGDERNGYTVELGLRTIPRTKILAGPTKISMTGHYMNEIAVLFPVKVQLPVAHLACLLSTSL